MNISLSALISIYTFSTGRRLFALAQLMKAAKDYKLKELVAHCEMALAYDQKTRALETQWAAPVVAPAGQGVVTRIDFLVDRVLVALRDTTRAQADGHEDTGKDSIPQKAGRLLTAIFPLGVQKVTQAVFVEELAAVDGIVLSLKSKELAPIVEELGLGNLAKRLAELAVEYRAALEAPDAEVMSFGDVRGARAQGQEHVLMAIAMILGRFPGATPDHLEARTALLGPILKQNEAIRLYLKSRRTVEDVNPETGEIDPNAPPVADQPAGEKTPA